MASACVNNLRIPSSSSSSSSSYGWLSPRISFSRDLTDGKPSDLAGGPPEAPSDLDFIDFEFHLNDPVAMLPADELFSDGKLVPLHLSSVRPRPSSAAADDIRPPDLLTSRRREEAAVIAMSPKAPRCSSRWRELLGLKKQQQQQQQNANPKPAADPRNPRSLKLFLHRNPKSCSSSDSNLSLPLLRDSDSEPFSISSRHSLSSTSSSGPDNDDLHRLSLDSDKPGQIPAVPISLCRNPPKVRVSRPRSPAPEGRSTARAGRSPIRRTADPAAAAPPRSASVDSPRMNSSGKVVFQGLGRSSSSPSTFNGGPRIKYKGMERSYSANVANVRVLNVPVCSLRGSTKFGFGQLFSQPRREKEGPAPAKVSGGGGCKGKN